MANHIPSTHHAHNGHRTLHVYRNIFNSDMESTQHDPKNVKTKNRGKCEGVSRVGVVSRSTSTCTVHVCACGFQMLHLYMYVCVPYSVVNIVTLVEPLPVSRCFECPQS